MQMDTNIRQSDSYQDELIKLLQDDTEKGVKRAMRLKEVADDTLKDIMEGEKFTPGHFIRSFTFYLLFNLEASGDISFPYDDVFEWVELKKAVYQLAELANVFFDFRKTRGRPTESSTNAITILGLFLITSNKLGKTISIRGLYLNLLSRAFELRLAACEEWSKHKSAYERSIVYAREFKAAKTSIDRVWVGFFKNKPARLKEQDKELINEIVLRHLARRKT